MRRLITILFVISTTNIFAQKVNYTVVENNPDNYKKTSLFIEPIFSEFYKGLAMGYGLKFETQVANFVPWVHYKKAYLDINTISSQVDILPDDKLFKHSVFEVGTTWFFYDKNKSTDIGMNLSSNQVGNLVYSKSITIKGYEKTMHGLDIGFFSGKNSVAFDVDIDDNVNPDWQYERVSDGLVVPMYFSVPSGVTQPEGSQWMPYTSYKTNTFFFGYRLRTVNHMKILVDNFGKKSKKIVFDWYTHFLYAPDSKYVPVVDMDGVAWNIIPVEGRDVISNMGFRTGFSLKAANFLQFYCETGYKPGLKRTASKFNGAFMGFGFGFFIGTKHGFITNKYSKELIIK